MNIKPIATLAAAILATSAWANTPAPADSRCGAGTCGKKEKVAPASKDAACGKKETAGSQKEAACSKKDTSGADKEAACAKKDAACSKK